MVCFFFQLLWLNVYRCSKLVVSVILRTTLTKDVSGFLAFVLLVSCKAHSIVFPSIMLLFDECKLLYNSLTLLFVLFKLFNLSLPMQERLSSSRKWALPILNIYMF